MTGQAADCLLQSAKSVGRYITAQALPRLCSFGSDRVTGRPPIRVICAESPGPRRVPPVCFAAVGIQIARSRDRNSDSPARLLQDAPSCLCNSPATSRPRDGGRLERRRPGRFI